MKIAVISAQVFVCPPKGYSGLEQIAWEQAKGLAQLGHKVTLIAPTGSTCPGCDVIPSGPAGQWDEARAFNAYGDELNKFDVVIDNSWQKWSYTLKQQGQLKAPILGVLHAPVNTMYQTLPDGIEKPCFVCISEDQKSHFEQIFGRPARRAYNGIDLDFYKSTGAPRTDRFLFLGRFSSIKGADLAIEACLKVGVGLDLIGDTTITGEPEYYQHCVSRCDGKQIVMRGGATRGECVHWFSQAHVMIHANMRFREPFGLAPVEAMACGVPVICWDNGAMRETVQKSHTGFIVDSIDRLLNAVDLVKTTVNGSYAFDRNYCRDWASQFSVQNMCKRYEQLAAEAIETGGW